MVFKGFCTHQNHLRMTLQQQFVGAFLSPRYMEDSQAQIILYVSLVPMHAPSCTLYFELHMYNKSGTCGVQRSYTKYNVCKGNKATHILRNGSCAQPSLLLLGMIFEFSLSRALVSK